MFFEDPALICQSTATTSAHTTAPQATPRPQAQSKRSGPPTLPKTNAGQATHVQQTYVQAPNLPTTVHQTPVSQRKLILQDPEQAISGKANSNQTATLQAIPGKTTSVGQTVSQPTTPGQTHPVPVVSGQTNTAQLQTSTAAIQANTILFQATPFTQLHPKPAGLTTLPKTNPSAVSAPAAITSPSHPIQATPVQTNAAKLVSVKILTDATTFAQTSSKQTPSAQTNMDSGTVTSIPKVQLTIKETMQFKAEKTNRRFDKFKQRFFGKSKTKGGFVQRCTE